MYPVWVCRILKLSHLRNLFHIYNTNHTVYYEHYSGKVVLVYPIISHHYLLKWCELNVIPMMVHFVQKVDIFGLFGSKEDQLYMLVSLISKANLYSLIYYGATQFGPGFTHCNALLSAVNTACSLLFWILIILLSPYVITNIRTWNFGTVTVFSIATFILFWELCCILLLLLYETMPMRVML